MWIHTSLLSGPCIIKLPRNIHGRKERIVIICKILKWVLCGKYQWNELPSNVSFQSYWWQTSTGWTETLVVTFLLNVFVKYWTIKTFKYRGHTLSPRATSCESVVAITSKYLSFFWSSVRASGPTGSSRQRISYMSAGLSLLSSVLLLMRIEFMLEKSNECLPFAGGLLEGMWVEGIDSTVMIDCVLCLWRKEGDDQALYSACKGEPPKLALQVYFAPCFSIGHISLPYRSLHFSFRGNEFPLSGNLFVAKGKCAGDLHVVEMRGRLSTRIRNTRSEKGQSIFIHSLSVNVWGFIFPFSTTGGVTPRLEILWVMVIDNLKW